MVRRVFTAQGYCRHAAMKRVLAAALIFVFCTTQAWAWGSEGHRIVAEIAEQYLQPSASHEVRDLLAIENATTLAEVANWADEIRGQRRNTARWHFVDIPISAPAYDPRRDCAQPRRVRRCQPAGPIAAGPGRLRAGSPLEPMRLTR